jgi:hypothetical protein
MAMSEWVYLLIEGDLIGGKDKWPIYCWKWQIIPNLSQITSCILKRKITIIFLNNKVPKIDIIFIV